MKRPEPPKGADPDANRLRASMDDVFNRLGTLVGLMERQNTMIYNMGLNAVEDEDYWHQQNSGR